MPESSWSTYLGKYHSTLVEAILPKETNISARMKWENLFLFDKEPRKCAMAGILPYRKYGKFMNFQGFTKPACTSRFLFVWW